ncbi:HIT domain-containing protein [Actinoplanes sp. LDG1-06]|uniref:HIT domain-containing protein n=1 Tax=Paractinoplanes ovalisporus TaxID=2810368 RepID=A0ABS2A9B7_9ACTN|nr:HIT domain-containing protein [Actinoplanes ovalisporus]MBM2615908.1 HIT domain-containing protein [Actinoplanes ovalisporus]
MTASGAVGGDCPICAKHRGEGPLLGGPLIWQDEHVLVFHRPPGVFLGHLFIESRRHAPYLDDLTDNEASAVGLAAARSARALRAALDPEAVFSAVIGRGVSHFHQHVFARHRGTPPELSWQDGDEWPDAPPCDAAAVADLADRLRRHFPGSSLVR